MATSSRFNRPYGPSAQGQAPWETMRNRPFGSDSLANRAATPSGRGYYDPERILERVARGRPGTSMQQAQAAMALEGFKEIKGLLGQQENSAAPVAGMPPAAPPPLTSPSTSPQNQGATPEQNQLMGAFMHYRGLAPSANRGGLAGYLDIMTQGWNDLGVASNLVKGASPRGKKVYEAKGSGHFPLIRDDFNQKNKAKGLYMGDFGDVYPEFPDGSLGNPIYAS